VHYITNFIIGFIFRSYAPSTLNNDKKSLKETLLNIKVMPFGEVITKALLKSINTLFLILGTLTCFLVITTIIDNNINLNNFNQALLNGFVEMTQGLKYTSLLTIPLKLKTILSVMIISFGGFSVHMQIMSILSGTKIKYLPFLTARVLHALISGLLIFFGFDLWMNLY
jgi:nucleoside recognition membrane protein YjiH